MTDEQLEYIRVNYKKIKAKDIADMLGVSVRTIYDKAKELGVNSKLNPELKITDIQKQIILGGILGDGSFKKNGSNYYYREVHAVGEKQYMLWKYWHLYSLTTKKVYKIPSRNGYSPQIGIQSVNSPAWTTYVQMTRSKVIEELDEIGFVVWVLDDGWISGHNNSRKNICVSSGTLTDIELQQILAKAQTFGIEGHCVGKRKDISLYSKYNSVIKEMVYRHLPNTIDVVIKKINGLQV